MKKKSSFSSRGRRADIGDVEISRILPNRYADAIGPFVFLDHIVPVIQTKISREGAGAHPHRGIATLTYILNGEGQHFDSAGNYAIVHSGGVQWMNAGNGIIHDETLNGDSRTGSELVHAFQFWINLPPAIKAGRQAYLAIEGNEVPRRELPGNSGWVKVIAGAFDGMSASIPSYSSQFLYHLHLESNSGFSFDFDEKVEVAAFLPTLSAIINDEHFNAGDFIEFDRERGTLELQNNNEEACEILLFGGESYADPIFAEGPFVMNSALEIAAAYRDFHNGKYGKIHYEKQKNKP